MWSEKHRPQIISDMVGNEESRAAIMEWFAKWKKGTKPLLLVGPPGIGKTTIAYLLAKQFEYDMIGLNASDVRSKSRINEILTPVLGNVSVLGTPMIFVDEVDGIHGRGDYGGAAALVDILKEPTVPIVLAANDDTQDKMKSIRKVVKTIYFKRLPPRLLRVYLENILKKESAKLSPGSLIKVIGKSHGDIRSMINLTQSLVTGFNPQTETSFESINVEDGVNAFFKANSIEEARGVLYSMQIDPRKKIDAFYSSIITSNLDNTALAKYLEIISNADMLYGKIMKTQNWRLLRYLNDVLIELYQNDDRIRYSQYNISWPLLNRIRWDRNKIKSLSSVMAKKLHLSSSTFVTLCLPYVLFCIKNKTLELEIEETFGDIIEKEIELI
ncbi:AAA family ATPase [Marine Group I thaumarchaeote]|uniref:AAA family ATPase n=1 Tax=Marine Group I thaumarchaeote TaxID=2511932 RepID=A0A7K4M6T1_9ARCH|nr:MAG: AAA family ATPase [Nitrosopumilus sp. YT1]NMI81840.1 AAA family ATPase [Candidatus Nitrosopumilus sp. MTA1]NWJ19779.1 AAA family ATPase [Marine Group I thaumarchaeote]NWJ28174.1 AAA family ATPase [Marine Group I thaumarchaeote]NWJ56653.1 AAA family ATPase [Marine Group I thaumarchaeote]